MARKGVVGRVLAAYVRELIELVTVTRGADSIVSATDAKQSAPWRATPPIERLEDRKMLASVSLSNGVLALSGSNGQQNNLTVSVSGSNYVAKANSISKTFSSSSVNSIRIIGGNEADVISVSTGISKAATVDGGYGADSISGGNGNDVLRGGYGNDTIRGNGGNDTIKGEAGNDYIDGGTGTNSLDGGTGTNTLKNAGTTSTTPTRTSSAVDVTAFELWDAGLNKKIMTLFGGETLDLAKLPAKLSIVVQGTSQTQSIKFGYDSNTRYRIETIKPWAIAGDRLGKLYAFTMTLGSHKVSATPYSGTRATGTAGATKTISITVKRSSTTSTGSSGGIVGGSTSGGTTSGSTSGGSTSGGTISVGGILPRDVSAAAPSAVITAVSDKTIHSGQSFSAHAMSSALNGGTPLTARYVWDFGDVGSKYNVLQGFNASHFYSRPGTYTVKLMLTNEAGKTDIATTSINVVSEGRKKIYVSTSGSDTNDGLSELRPLRTFAKAVGKLASNEEILFKGGETFDVKISMNIWSDNVVIGSYGTGKAILKYSGPRDYSNMIYLGGQGGSEATVENLIFDSIYTGSDKRGLPQAIGTGGRGDTIINCEFRNLGYAINAEAAPDGLLVQQNTAPIKTGLRGYFAWASGKDIAFLGNYVSNVDGHVIRMADMERVLVNDNDFTNPDETSGIRGTLTIHKGSYAYVSNNHFTDGKLTVGPLGNADGLSDKAGRWNWAVFEGNVVKSQVIVEHGAQHIMYRNNIVKNDNDWGFEVEAYSSEYGRGVVDVTFVNNTVVNNGSIGNFLHVDGAADGINLINNLYLAPNLTTGTSGSAPVFVYDNDLSSFDKITGNVWPLPTIDKYAEGGINYVWPIWSNSAGYKTPAEWEAYGQVDKDYYADVGFNSATFAPLAGSVAANAGIVWKGVFADMNGKIRSNSGGWTAGAVEV